MVEFGLVMALDLGTAKALETTSGQRYSQNSWYGVDGITCISFFYGCYCMRDTTVKDFIVVTFH